MAKQEITYAEALAEAERILQRIQQEEISVDELSAAVKRATELISACKKRLRKAEEEIQKILE